MNKLQIMIERHDELKRQGFQVMIKFGETTIAGELENEFAILYLEGVKTLIVYL